VDFTRQGDFGMRGEESLASPLEEQQKQHVSADDKDHDNDLALGRIVQALRHSPYWKDTVIFVVEDDAQAGPDHTDSHRAPFYAISAYSRAGTVHHFINTTDVVAAIEDILGTGRLSKFACFSRSLADIFAPAPDLTPYDPIIPTQDLNEKNPQNTAAARLSESLDLSAPDRVDDQFL
jgi:hypothetical protein